MGRLVDIDNLKGCAIIRPTNHETIEHIKQCGNDVLNHDDIPTAFDVERVVAELEKASRTMMPVIPTSEAIDILKGGGNL